MMGRVVKLGCITTMFWMLGTVPAYATIIVGETVDALGSDSTVGTTEVRASLGGVAAVKYFIPLTDSPVVCVYGVNCGTSSDSGDGGTVMSMFMKFSPLPLSGSGLLQILFEDLDLAGANDPYGFLETIEVFDDQGNSLTNGVITNIANVLVTGNAYTQQLLSLDIGAIGSSSVWLKLDFSASYIYQGKNTPEYLYATITSVPEPASLALLGAGLLGIGLMRRKRRLQPLS